MKYWILTTEYPPFHGGGISTYCRFTAEMLTAAGHEVTVFVPDDSVTDAISEHPDLHLTLTRFNSNRNNLQASLGYTARLSYAFADIVRTVILQKGRPDFIEAQDYLGIAYYLTQFKHTGYTWCKDIPIIITLHSPAFVYLEYNRVPTYRFPDFWTGEMEKHSIAGADLLISPTRFLVEEIKKFMPLRTEDVHVLPNPYRTASPAPIPIQASNAASTSVPTPVAAHVPASAQPSNQAPVSVPPLSAAPAANIPFIRNRIVYYGKLSPQKGSFELLTCFKQLWDEGFPHPLHIIGGTDIVFHPEMKTMGRLVKKKYNDYISRGLLVLHGKIRHDQIEQNLKDAHCIIVPSIVDNLPYVVMESMSLGKIVLASEQGGQREMLENGVSGFLFDHTIPASFPEQLKKILELSDESVQRIGINACHRVNNLYSFGKIGAEKESILQDWISTKTKNADERFPFLYQEPITTAIPAPDLYNNLLSVVIPFFNMGDYIGETIASVKASTYQDLEILIVDDGSTDNASLKKLQQLARAGKIRIITQQNQGLAAARNNGALQAKGYYLAFLDADDKVDPSYYEKAITALQKPNVFFVGAWVRYFGNSDRLWPTFTPQPPYTLAHNPVNSSGLVYKKAAFIQGGLNDRRTDYGLEDYESVINMLHHGYNGVVLPEPLFHYRVRSDSMFRQVTREKLLYSNKYILEKHADYYTKFAVQLVNLLNANGPGFLFDNPTFEVSVTSKMAGNSAFYSKLKSFVKRNEKVKSIVLALKKLKS